MSNITLRQAALWCEGHVEEKYADVEFFGANIDSRKILPGQLFIALEGVRDGHDFIPMAMEQGPRLCCVSTPLVITLPLWWRIPGSRLVRLLRCIASSWG